MVRSAPQNVALIERYLNLRATRLSRNTIAAYRADLLHFASSLGPTSLLEATPDNIAAWFRAHSRTEEDPDDRRPWSARTAHRRRAALSRFYDWAHRQELVRRSPLDEIELPRYHRKPPLVIESDQIERVFAHAEDCIRHGNRRVVQVYVLDVAVLRLMERLALRVSEAVGIRLSRVTSVGNELHAWIVKKGNKPKTYPLTGLVLEAYTRWLDLRRAVQPIGGHEDFVFVHPRTGRRVSRQHVWIRLKRLAEEARLPAETVMALSPHKLRHARARTMLHSGWDIAAVQSVLDHASIQSTQVYVQDSERARLETLRAQSQHSTVSR